MQKPGISIVIPTYNRAVYLTDTLDSLIKNEASPSGYEIIVVDNNSTDHTGELVAKFIKNNSRYRISYVIEKNQGAAFTRNRGIREANADLLLFVDDDEIADHHLIENWLAFFNDHPDAVGGGGSIKVKFEAPCPNWMSHFLMPLLGQHKISNSIKKYPRSQFPFAGNMAFRRQVFEKYGTLETSLGRKGTELLAGEEKEFYQRLRKHTDQIYHVPDAFIYHRVGSQRFTKNFIRKQALGIGQSIRLQHENASSLQKLMAGISELIKIIGTIVLGCGYSLLLQFPKAKMLFSFRRWIWQGYHQGTLSS